MKLSERAVKKPISTIMFFLGILLFGIVSWQMLSLDVMPEIEMPTLTIITVYPGASAENVESQVTDQLERVLGTAENLRNMSSKSKENVSFISLEFSWGEDVSEAASNVRDLIELESNNLPENARDPLIAKINSSMMPVLLYGITATESYNGLSDIIEDNISSRLRKIEGVGSVIAIGAPEREIRIELDPEKLHAYNLSIQQIGTILAAENITIPSGDVKMNKVDYALTIPGELENVEDLGDIAIASFMEKIIRLKDVAVINDTFKEKTSIARTVHGNGVALMIQKQTGANTLKVVESVRNEVAALSGKLPDDLRIDEVMFADELVRESINNLSSTLLYALIFVILVVLAFLREWRSALIILLTIPFSLITAMIVMYAGGYTINIFTLLALLIAIGMVVDNAIVVLENITRHLEQGERPLQAAIFGTSEMSTAIMASTATTLMVFLPLIFMGGVVGILFKPLAIITSATMIASLITAMTLTPVMAAKLKKDKVKKLNDHHKLFRFSESVFVAGEKLYANIVNWAVEHRKSVGVILIIMIALTFWLAKNISTDYIPSFDAGDVGVVFHTEVGSSVSETQKAGEKIMQIMEEEIPEMVPNTMAMIAGQTEDGLLSMAGFEEGKNVGTVLCHLELCNKRNRSASEIADVIRKRIGEIPEIESYRVTGGSVLSAAITGNAKPIEIELYGDDLDHLNTAADEIMVELNEIPGFVDISSTADAGKMEIRVELDRKQTTDVGLNSAMVGLQVRQAVFGMDASEFEENGSEYEIRLQYATENRNSIEDISRITLTTLRGTQVKLGDIANITIGNSPQLIEHENQQRVVFVKADLNELALGEAITLAEDKLAGKELPAGIEWEMGGQVSDQSDSFNDLKLILILSILLVYMIMAGQFESFKEPFIIMIAVPLTFLGVVWAFLITGETLSISSFIGIIMLMGIVVNNGIVLVDYTNLLMRRGMNLLPAVKAAGISRLRPVLMTSLTTILGMLPMALSRGIGNEMFRPMGITIIGGLFVSTLITLIVVPVIYTSMNYRQSKKEGRL